MKREIDIKKKDKGKEKELGIERRSKTNEVKESKYACTRDGDAGKGR